MQRMKCAPREDWNHQLEAIGFSYHSIGGNYWVEDGYYRFSEKEIDVLEHATNELHAMCIELVAETVASGDYDEFGLSITGCALVERSWSAAEPMLYGRLDIAYDGQGSPKLLEYNADTPTALFEASIAQWHWLQAQFPDADQFNLIHETLIEQWKKLSTQPLSIHFTGVLDSPEDALTLEYLLDTALQAGHYAQLVEIQDIGWNGANFIDLNRAPMRHVFKLYPWEWLLHEEFGLYLDRVTTRWIEPAWKQLLSNKSLLVKLWQRYPGHPNLLASSHQSGMLESEKIVSKPRFGREGEGVSIMQATRHEHTETGLVYQAYTPLFQSREKHAVIGSWIIGDKACGIGVREDAGLITTNTSQFVPHCFY